MSIPKVRRSNRLRSKRQQSACRALLERLEDRRLLATNITQYHVDSQSTGANLTETQLTPLNVNAADFGQLYNTPVDGQVYAEPLVLTDVAIAAGPNTVGTPGTYNSVVFVATQHDSLYAINAANGTTLWHRTFLDTTNSNDFLPGATSVTSVPSDDTNTGDISPEVGITGTPVIDPSTNIIYVLAKTKEIVDGNAFYVQRLHAIKVGDGTDAVSAFVIGTTTDGNTNNTPIYANGTGDGSVDGVVQFNALRENNRAALSLVNGNVYVAWASHGDNGPYHGWVVAWNVTNLATKRMVLSGALCTDPNGAEGGIWGGGGGLTFDPSETFNGQPAFYFETGNGAPRGGDPPVDANGFPSDASYYESLVKVEADPTTTATNQNSNGWGLKIVDYFTPYNVNALDDADEDFGSGSPLVLPDSAGIPGHPHLIVAAGKEGKIYLLDRDSLGKFSTNTDNVLNAVNNSQIGVTTPPVLINGSLSTPAYYHGTIYWVSGFGSNAWSYIVAPNPAPSPPSVPVATIEPTSETANGNFGYLPGSVMISANGSEDPAGGIAWIMDRSNGEIHAYSTLSLSTELWNSGPGSIATVKFAVPTVANGQVFVGTQNSLQVFGITGPGVPVHAPNAPVIAGVEALSGTDVELEWADGTVSPNFATSYTIEASTDGSSFVFVANTGQETTHYTVTGLSPNTTYQFRIIGSNSAGSSSPSNVASVTTPNQTGQIPNAPRGLGATPASGSEVYLTWTNTASNETGFKLTRATDSLFTQNVVTETLASAPYYYTDVVAGLSPGHTYYYKLQAINSAGLSSSSNTASVNIPNVPPAPTNAGAVLSNDQIVVSWTDHAGPFALGYQIFRSIDGGPFTLYTERPETSDSPPSTQSFTDASVPVGHTYTYEILAQNVSGFSAPAFASASVLGHATLALDQAGNMVYTALPGVPDRLSVQLAAGIYTVADPAVTISVTGAGAGFVAGAGTSALTIPAAHVSAMTLDTSDNSDSIRIISAAVPITISADSGGGTPAINLGDPTHDETLSARITNASDGILTIAGAGITTITGNLICQGSGGVALTGAGTINVSGNINLGPVGNLVDSSSGKATISGIISGTAKSGLALAQGLIGTYFNLPAAQALIEPANSSNSAWLGNQAPARSTQLVGPIDFPDIPDNGFADSLGNPAYYNVGNGNDNVEARWHGNITIPGTGTAPVPINFATTSDDGSMLYVDGVAVVNNNNFQGPTQATGLAQLTPGVHAIDVEFYQGGGGASMVAQWDPAGGTDFVDIPNSAFSSIQAVNGLRMSGTGTLTLSNTNTYFGSTTIDSGTVVVAANGALGSATATGIIVNRGAALALTGGVNYATSEPLTINGAGPAGKGAIENLSGTNAFSIPITMSGPATLGSDAGSMTLAGNLAAGTGTLTVIGAGATTITGNITCQGGNIALESGGIVTITGNINLGAQGNLTDAGSGQETISGVISGTGTSGLTPGLTGTYFNLPASAPLIQPADSSNSSWLGNQTPAVTRQLAGPIDFPDIASNGFADSAGNPAYYNLGNGNNNNVEARWYGDIVIPGTGSVAMPINFATTSDDGSMLYIDGNAVVNNNNMQAPTQATGLVNLTPGLHTIDVEYYQGGGGASMDVQWDPTGGTNFVDIPLSALVQPGNSLYKTGTSTLTLTRTNNYKGATVISAGTLVVEANGALGPGSASGIVVDSGGALALAGGVNYTAGEAISISGAGPGGKGALENISGANTFASPVTMAGSATIGSDAGVMTLIGSDLVVGSNTLTVIGAGTTVINCNIVCPGGNLALAASGAITIGGNIQLGAQSTINDSNSGHDTITGVISGGATTSLVMSAGAGTLILQNNNTYSGPTTVNAGKLVVDGQLPNSTITVNTGGTLGGHGLVSAASVHGGGFLSPGDPLGTLTVGSLSLTAGSTLTEQLGGTSPGTTYPQTFVSAGGTVALANATLNLSFATGFLPTIGQQFTLIANGSGGAIGGTFSQGSTFAFAGYAFGINYSAGPNHDVVLTVLARTSTTLVSAATGGGALNSSLYGQNVTFTATATANAPAVGTPTGTVTFRDGSTVLGTVPLKAGSARVSLSTLAVGSHSVTASFSGTDNWANSASSLTETVKPAPTTTAVASSLGSSVFGQSVVLTATVRPTAPGAGTPSGTVTFRDGNKILGAVALNGVSGNDQARLSIASLSAGKHSITALYGAATSFSSSTSTIVRPAVSATPQLQNGVLAVPGTASAATITLTPTLPKGGTRYSLNVSYTVNGTTTKYGPFAASTIAVYGRPGNDAVTLNGTSGSDAFTVGSGLVTENAAQTTSFTVRLSAVTSITLNGQTGLDRLTGPNQANAWAINGSNAGTLNGSFKFRNIANLTGGSLGDTFTLAKGGALTGSLSGGAGTNTLDDSKYGSPVTVNLQTKTATGIGGTWASIQAVVGTGTSDTLVGANVANIWSLTATNAGKLGSYAFSAFPNLTGGSANDTFKFSPNGSLTGVVKGKGGANTLDYSGYGSPVTVNFGNATTGLATSSATGIRGGAANGIADIGAVIVGSGDNYLTAVGVTTGVSFKALGNGNNILVGGSGNNTLTASGSGNNLLIGGKGTATLIGGTGYNLLIGGSTAYDAVLADLEAILDLWKPVDSAGTYATAIANLTATSSPRFLTATTVHGTKNDSIRAGTHALDWYFATVASEITGKTSGETDTPC